MPLQTTPRYDGAIFEQLAQITDSTDTGLVTILDADANYDRMVEIITATSTDTTASKIQIYKSNGTVDRELFVVDVPIESGTKSDAGAAAVDILGASNNKHFMLDVGGNKFMLLKKGWSLKVKTLTELTTAKVVNFFVAGHSYEAAA